MCSGCTQANKLGNKADKLGNDVGSAASNLSGNPAQQAINKVIVCIAAQRCSTVVSRGLVAR